MKKQIARHLISAFIGFAALGCGSAPSAAPPAPTEAAPPVAPTALAAGPATAIPASPTAAPLPVEAADVVFFNGNVITMELHQALASALAVKGDRILAVGSDDELQARVGPETAQIDLGGRTLVPAFVDPHTHILKDSSMSLEQAQQLLLENGVATAAETFATPQFVQSIRAFADDGKLRVRTSLYLGYADPCGRFQGDWYRQHAPTDEFSEMLRIGGVKLFADGSQVCGHMALSFSTPGGYEPGPLWLTQDEMDGIVAELHSEGYQVALHAQGDRAIEQAQNAIAAALNGAPNTPRHRVEHNTILRPDLLARYGEIGVVPVIFGVANTCVQARDNRAARTFGEEHLGWLENWRALADAKPRAHIAWKSDYPFFPAAPLVHLYSLVTRKEVDENGEVCDPPDWLAAHALRADEALRMMTTEAAYALFREDEVGSLAAGKLADIVVLSGDPLGDPDRIKDLRVLLTMVGGATEYCAEGSDEICP